ncbi:response regulator [Neptuniibacter sp. QD72_48]|uniref:hybrid sensor histidine kinase/response regulator n=1 Tax=unclassified Neptuniibacter TaxID=2630693 RepID=UPI0039F6F809
MADILVVDDVADNLKVLRNIFVEKGYGVRVATNGLMAIKSATTLPPDLILMDINMPKMDGIEACIKLKENPITANIPIIFVTANTELEMVIKGLHSGGVDYITKPFMHEEVIARAEVHINLVKTQQRYANAEIMSAIGQMVVGVSHELNTPLGICVTSASSMKADLDSLRTQVENEALTKNGLDDYLSKSEEQLKLIEGNFASIVHKLDHFKTITLDQIENQPRTINLAEYVQECIKLLHSTLMDESFQISLDCEALEVNLNPGYLFHIISNLVSNTVAHAYSDDFSGPKQINLKVYLEDGHIGLMYWDNGIGVTQSVLKQVLKPFYTTKLSDPNHLGLSASIINGIVTMILHGTLSLQCDKRGLVYDINFPIKQVA